jgi:hypothetical protein
MDLKYSPLCVIALLLILGIFILIKKPYVDNKQNYRFIVNLLIMMIVQAIYQYYILYYNKIIGS